MAKQNPQVSSTLFHWNSHILRGFPGQPCWTTGGYFLYLRMTIPLHFWGWHDILPKPCGSPKPSVPFFSFVGPPRLQHAVALLVTAAPQREVAKNMVRLVPEIRGIDSPKLWFDETLGEWHPGNDDKRLFSDKLVYVWWEDLSSYILPFTWLCGGVWCILGQTHIKKWYALV